METIITIIIIVVVFLILRAFGAWMFRINDVISYQKEILEELKKLNGSRNV